MKYRIKTKAAYDGSLRYVPQKKRIFWWNMASDYLSIFTAESYIKEDIARRSFVPSIIKEYES